MTGVDDLARLAQAEAVLKALADAVYGRLKEVRADLQDALDATDSVRKVAAVLPGGVEVATIAATGGRAEAVVIDADAFLKWAITSRPAAVSRRFVTEVSASYKAALLNEMTAAGVPEVVDTESGVVETVPGVEIRPVRARTHRVTFTKAGREAIGKAWRDGDLADHMPQLTEGDAS
jgi:hypothetical protein